MSCHRKRFNLRSPFILLLYIPPCIILASFLHHFCIIFLFGVSSAATCQGRIHHFLSLFLGLPCFPCRKSWRMTRFNLSFTLWVLISEKCTSFLAQKRRMIYNLLFHAPLLPNFIKCTAVLIANRQVTIRCSFPSCCSNSLICSLTSR